jgi:hypothetical protein
MDFGGGPLTTTGTTAWDIFLAKFDGDGNHLWSKRFGDSNDQRAGGIACDAMTGAVVLASSSRGTVDFGGGPLASAGGFDIMVAKFDASGNHQWSKRFGDSSDQFIHGLAVDSSGNTVVAGSLEGSVNFGDPAGSLTSAGSEDVFVAKLSPSGSAIWSKRFGDSSSQDAFALAVDEEDAVLLTGSMSGTIDFGAGAMTSAGGRDVFVARLNQDGSYAWASHFGDALAQTPFAIDADASGNVLITGSFGGAINFGGNTLVSQGASDMFVAKLDAAGKHLSSSRFGDPSDQQGLNGAFDADGNIFLAGVFSGTVDVGLGPLTSSGGGQGILVAKLSP